MLSVRGVYRDGKVELLESIPGLRQARVIVTILDDGPLAEEEGSLDALKDLVGAISVREDGAIGHDRYVYGKGGP